MAAMEVAMVTPEMLLWLAGSIRAAAVVAIARALGWEDAK